MKTVPMMWARAGLAAIVSAALLGASLAQAAPVHADSPPSATFNGVVRLDGVPAGGLGVCVYALESAGGSYGCHWATTAADGSYTYVLELFESFQLVKVSVYPGADDEFRGRTYGADQYEIGGFLYPHDGEVFAGIDISVVSYPMVSGKVVNTSGAPIPGARVNGNLRVATTNAMGGYQVRVEDSVGHVGQIIASAAGYQSRTVSVDTAKTGTLTIKLSKLLKAAKPTITGTTRVSKKLTAHSGAWGPSGVKLSYQWYRNGKKIAGAKRVTYKLTKSDQGKKIEVRVTGKLAGYATVTKASKLTKKVAKR